MAFGAVSGCVIGIDVNPANHDSYNHPSDVFEPMHTGATD
jgi:hypothetical protein